MSESATESRTGVYEVMFLVGQAQAVEFASLIEHIENLIERASGEILAMEKWDEKRLAYPIEKQRRGVFILTYIKAPRDGISQLERDVNISERLMRALVVRADHLTPEQIAAHDNRDQLGAEAKLRAERAEEEARREAQKVEVLTAEQAAARAEQEASDHAASEAPEQPAGDPEPQPAEQPTEG